MNALINLIKATYLGGYSTELVFNDGKSELCFPVKDLYANQISHSNADLIAA